MKAFERRKNFILKLLTIFSLALCWQGEVMAKKDSLEVRKDGEVLIGGKTIGTLLAEKGPEIIKSEILKSRDATYVAFKSAKNDETYKYYKTGDHCLAKIDTKDGKILWRDLLGNDLGAIPIWLHS